MSRNENEYARYLTDPAFALRFDRRLARDLRRQLLERNPDAAKQLRWLRGRSDDELRRMEIELLERGVEKLRARPDFATNADAQHRCAIWGDQLNLLRDLATLRKPRVARYRPKHKLAPEP